MVTINLTFALILEIEFRCQSLRDKMKYDSKYEIRNKSAIYWLSYEQLKWYYVFLILVIICEHIDINGK